MRASEMEIVNSLARQFHWWDVPNTVAVPLCAAPADAVLSGCLEFLFF